MDAASTSIEQVEPDSTSAAWVLRAYYTDIVRRYHGGAATEAGVDAAMADEPNDDLMSPTGLLLLARSGDGDVLGCAGLRLLPAHVGELTRVFVLPEARGHGLGARLVRELEERAHTLGIRLLRLETRSDLVEARRLYARLGYTEVEPFNDEPYAEHWFAKSLRDCAAGYRADRQ